MTEVKMDLRQSLSDYFGFENFKGNQEAIIESVFEGRDTFVIMPTGGGKSLCYQLPALMMEGSAIIISPLIALMKNQVDAIRGFGEKDEVAHFLNSSLTRAQATAVKEDLLAGKTKLLYVAPETLTKEENVEMFRQINVSFVAVDEAHCISEWGHDFRPEYRRIRDIIEALGSDIPIVALTATATPKVQSDIIKNLQMQDVRTFVSSFNRENLFYQVRPKKNKQSTIRSIVKFVKSMPNESGIIYVQSRKATQELAKALQVNDIKAAPYHAGLDAKTRASVQDAFLMEDIDVICATIAFGMGIDKPDVRFVIHYDMPKSIENYYQETGRAGRDGLEGHCLAFFSHKDILKLEKFLRDKPVSEREMGGQLLEEVIAYAETAACRRKFLLHYFGEEFDDDNCGKMCDNCKNPKEKTEAGEDIQLALMAVDDLGENFTIKTIVDYITGKQTKEMNDFEYAGKENFGKGRERDDQYWHSVIRHSQLLQFVYKNIEQYGVLKLTEKGRAFIKSPHSVSIAVNHEYSDDESGNGMGTPHSATALDDTLLRMLKDLRKEVADKKEVPPYVVFQDPSLKDMATQYPVSMEDMTKITGVSMGKARRYARPFIEMIQEYVEENEIDRPTDFIIKQVANKSKVKVNIIQAVDRKIPLEDIARQNNLKMEELFEEMEMIVSSGTKLNVDYLIQDRVDEYSQEDIYDYFLEAESDDINDAYKELKEDDITVEEIRLVRMKFLTELAN